MMAWTSSGFVPKVGGISDDSSTPSRPLVPAPTKTMRPPPAERLREDLDPDGNPVFLALHGREHLAILVKHAFDEVGRRQLVEGEGVGIDGFGGKRLPLRTQGHNDRNLSKKPRILS